MNIFRIYHPVDEILNTHCSKDISFKFVAQVFAKTLQGAYRMSQNDFNDLYRDKHIRSTCIGDVILDTETGQVFMVSGSGFEQFDTNILYNGFKSSKSSKLTPETLAKIKKALTKFYKLYESLVKTWNGQLEHGNNATYPHTIIALVLLNNMAISTVKCVGYDHQVSEDNLYANLKQLELLNEYHDKNYMTHYAYAEAESIITGHYMMQN